METVMLKWILAKEDERFWNKSRLPGTEFCDNIAMNLRITQRSESCLTTLTTTGIPFSLFHGLCSESNMD